MNSKIELAVDNFDAAIRRLVESLEELLRATRSLSGPHRNRVMDLARDRVKNHAQRHPTHLSPLKEPVARLLAEPAPAPAPLKTTSLAAAMPRSLFETTDQRKLEHG